MKTQLATYFVAEDGTKFTSEPACFFYEATQQRLKDILTLLGPVPKDDGCSFSNGHGYLQHDAATWHEVRMGILRLALETFPKEHVGRMREWIENSVDDPSIDSSWAGRALSEFQPSTTYQAWYRIMCTDKAYREWGQPYYASHPYEGEQKRLNP